MKRSMLIATVAAALLLAGPVVAQTDDAPATQESSAMSAAEFVQQAAQSNMLEIRTSRLALERASSEEVRAFARQMVEDHTTATEQLQQVAGAVDDAGVPQELDDQHRQKIADLEAAPAEAFDDAYMALQIDAHQKAVDLFAIYAETGEGEIAGFATVTLAKLRAHLAAARSIRP